MKKPPFSSFRVSALCALALLAGCDKYKEPENLRVPMVMIESRSVDYGGNASKIVKLPVSGTNISVQGTPVVNQFEITNVELVKVDLGLALMIQVSDQGRRDLYRASVTNMGGRLVFVVNGSAIGARVIDQAMPEGYFYTFVEVQPDEMEDLVLGLKDTIAYLATKLQ